ncbi:hypothetical protein [Streptomyces sp. NPDC056169]|uniref:hypothetical protein n=1 Tax=Streptomyces sp. NPDC056169 TaxID=3345734 RepID=UPI0035E0FA69
MARPEVAVGYAVTERGERGEHLRSLRKSAGLTRDLADEPDAYDPYLDVDFTPSRGGGPPTDGFSQAAYVGQGPGAERGGRSGRVSACTSRCRGTAFGG